MGTVTLFGENYSTVRLPNYDEWIARNLSYTGYGLDYNNNPANRPIFGKLYTFAQLPLIQAGLPEGWTIAYHAHWLRLITALSPDEGIKTKSTSDSQWFNASFNTNSSGLTLEGGGYADVLAPGEGFFDLKSIGIWWFYDAVEGAGNNAYAFTEANSLNVSPNGNTSSLGNWAFSVRVVRSPLLLINNNGIWDPVYSMRVADNGTWKNVTRIMVPYMGGWTPTRPY